MKQRLAGWLLALGAISAVHSAQAQEVKAVVELFTSQGCSSCPPADRLLSELARERTLVALTMPVDYWDYLGWKDTLAQPLFTSRQRSYAHRRGDHAVYTPQMVVNGKAHVLGSDRGAVQKAVAASALPVSISVEENGSGAKVRVSGTEAGGAAAEVVVLPVQRTRAVKIQRGENTGKSITYANVARGIHRLGSWNGGAATFEVPGALVSQGDADGFVVLVQREEQAGAVLGAAYSRSLRPGG